MLHDTIHRFSSQRATCKQWSVFLGVAILLAGALGKLSAASLLWAAAPLLLLGLAEAGYAGQERRCAELLKKGQDEASALLPEAAGTSIVRTAVAVMSLSIWPFYLGLLAIVAAGALTSPRREAIPQSSQPEVSDAALKKAIQQYLQTTPGPMPVQTMPQRIPSGVTFPARPPMNPIQRSTPPAFQPSARPANPNPGAAFPQPAAPAASPSAPVPGAPAPAGKNP